LHFGCFLALSQSDPFGYVSKKTNNYKINMKTITLITLFVGALAFITNAYASVSGNLGVATDYIWRGQSQGDTPEAFVNGGIDYAGEGYYAGAWIGSLQADVEVNYYAGTDINGFDVGIIKYEFATDGDATEGYVGYSIQGFDLSYAQDLDESKNEFFSVSYALPTIIEGISSVLTYGDVSKALDDQGVDKSYDYLQLDISYGDLTITLTDEDVAGTTTALSYSWAL
jgi:uncharacterized protein (TIGR02001 family)